MAKSIEAKVRGQAAVVATAMLVTPAAGEAADVAGAIRPRIVVPAHYDMFATNLGDVAAFVAPPKVSMILAISFSLRCRVLPPATTCSSSGRPP